MTSKEKNSDDRSPGVLQVQEDFPAASRADHRERLRTLKDLDGIIDLKVGEDVVRAQRSYDTGIVVLFRDRAALDAYQAHPRHVVVGPDRQGQLRLDRGGGLRSVTRRQSSRGSRGSRG